MGPRDKLRAGDSDREVVAERLQAAVTDGRLDLDEYDQRLGAVYAAKTYGELDRLLADLPGPAPAPSPPRSVTRPAPGAVRLWLAAQWRTWAQVVSVCVAIWAVTAIGSASLPYFWPFWVAVPWGAVLLVRTAGGLASGEPYQLAAPRPRRGC
jgi:hypothetical protein